MSSNIFYTGYIFNKLYLKVLTLFFAFCVTAFSRSDSINKIQQITPGKQYDVNWINRMLNGNHWRDLWATKISVKVLDINTFGGGLKPLKPGGGRQTKSLRLIGNDSNEYKFRSIDKFPYKSLPPEWQNSYYADMLQDQVSIGLPVAPLIVYPMMKEVGILAVQPELVILPDSDLLGKYKKEFSGQLGIIELNPAAGKKGLKNFEGADKIVNGFKIFKILEKTSASRVDQTEFLKARLMDIFIGDRDRHADQWQWAGYDRSDKTVWKPVPRDRDYAFGKYDGLFPWASGYLVHSLQGFNDEIPQLLEITWTGRHLDRRFLNEIDKPVWDSVSNFITEKLTDEVILNAVKKMPPEMYKIEGQNLFEMLKSRRGQLVKAAEEFYELISDVTDIYGSNENEFAEIKVLSEKTIDLKLYSKDKDSGNGKSGPLYERRFNSDETAEIRLYLLEGDDDVKISGKAKNDILLRVISDKGSDVIEDKSNLNIKVYDSDNNTIINTINGVYLNNDIVEAPSIPVEKYEPVIEDRYHFWAVTPILDFNSDNGFVLGGGPNYTQHGFRADPNLYYLQLTGAYATAESEYDVSFYGVFNKIIHRSKVEFFLNASELDYNRFYGFGNQTQRDPDLAAKDYYKARQQSFTFSPVVTSAVSKNFSLIFGGSYRYSNSYTDDNSGDLLSITKPSGFGKISDFGLSAGFTYISLDNTVSPEKGIYSLLNFTYYPNIFNLPVDFSKVYAEINGYLTIKTFTDLSFVLKAGGQNNFGNYVFYEAAAVGGQKTLRGYPRERFQGDASLFGQSELRIKIAGMNLLLPSVIGISALSDIGRVFIEGENSSQWHSTYGGGVWMEIKNAFVMNFRVALSPEVTRYYFTIGTGF